MKITMLTLFPEMFAGPFSESIIKRAQERDFVEIRFVNIRHFGEGRHKVVDDKPYGGGVGMVMKVDILDRAIEYAKSLYPDIYPQQTQTILLDPRGQTYTQSLAHSLSEYKHLIFLCAHYEGVDERVRSLVDTTISLGDFVVTGGEIPAMLIADSVIRLIPGVLKDDATQKESFHESEEGFLLEYPQYTTPREYKGMHVPEVLTSGDHAKIEAWQKEQSLLLTKKHREDLLKK